MDFEDFYKLYFKYVYRYFYYNYVEASLLEDLCQEVFLRFYQKYTQYSDDPDVKRILYGFCRNVYREYVRENIARKQIPYEDEIGYEVDEYEMYNEAFEKHQDEKRKIISDMLNKLPRVLGEVIRLRFYESKRRAEVAFIMSISEGSVHTYQKRAVKKLIKIAKEMGYDKLYPPLHNINGNERE